MKKYLIIILAALTLMSCLKDNEQKLRIYQNFDYFETTETFSNIVYKNYLCIDGDGKYAWVSEEIPQGDGRIWSAFVYENLADMADDFGKLSKVSCYTNGEVVRYAFSWRNAEEYNRISYKVVDGGVLIVIHLTSIDITVPEEFIIGAKRYLDDCEI